MFDRVQRLAASIAACLVPALACLGAPLVWAGDTLRDPTRPADAVEAPAQRYTPSFVVSAIFISNHRRVAVLNGRAVSAGDRVNGATVTAVTAHDVELDYAGRTLRAPLSLARVRE